MTGSDFDSAILQAMIGRRGVMKLAALEIATRPEKIVHCPLVYLVATPDRLLTVVDRSQGQEAADRSWVRQNCDRGVRKYH